jgi:hypothetical protein
VILKAALPIFSIGCFKVLLRNGTKRAHDYFCSRGFGDFSFAFGVPLARSRLHFFEVQNRMTTSPEYKQHKLEVVTTLSEAGSWGVEVSVTWQQGLVERKMKYGPYQGFVSPVDAQCWAIISCISWIDSGKSEPSAFIPTQAQQDPPAARRVNHG